MKPYCELLRELREGRDLKQSDIAAVLGTTQQVYSRYETGRVDLPLRHLKALTSYYQVSADYILGNSPLPQIPPELSSPFTPKITNGELLSYVQSFRPGSKRRLIEYINYLKYLEHQKKENE